MNGCATNNVKLWQKQKTAKIKR